MRRFLLPVLFLIFVLGVPAMAQVIPGGLDLGLEELSPPRFSTTINLLFSVAIISFIPFIVVSTSSFIRIIIVLSLLRQAVGTQQSPPNMVITSLAIFLTVFVMTPVWQEVQQDVMVPYRAGEITQKEALEQGYVPLQNFMLKLTRDKDLALFLEFSQVAPPDDYKDIPFYVLIPSFIISELRAAFQIAFILFIPFIVIDLIVSNILLSLGMFMLSPAIISLPFKILLFVLTDGWNLIIQGLLLSFK